MRDEDQETVMSGRCPHRVRRKRLRRVFSFVIQRIVSIFKVSAVMKYMPVPHSVNIGQSDNIVVEFEAYDFRVGGIENTTFQNVSELCNEE